MNWKPWRWPLATQILVGLLIGAGLGLIAEYYGSGSERLNFFVQGWARPIGTLFLQIIFMMVIPLIVSAIILGVAELGDLKKLGRVGIRCLVITLILASSSVGIGLALVNLFRPGERLSAETRHQLITQYAGQALRSVEQGKQKRSLLVTLLDLIPRNPFAEAVHAFNPNHSGGGLVAVMVFALFLGAAMAACPRDEMRPLLDFCQALFLISMKIIGFAMRLAPFCVACLAFAVTAQAGVSILQTLGFYVTIVLMGLLIQQFGTYSFALRFFGNQSPFQFFKAIREAAITAFGTSSSNATLPVSLRVAEENLKLPPKISRFVLTVGATANQNGTALYEGVTVLFLAQVFGIDLSWTQQLVVALMCLLAGIGTAGIPGGSLPLVVGVLMSIGVPPESIAIILGVDRFLDMCRTTLNVTGDLVCATLVSQSELKQAAI